MAGDRTGRWWRTGRVRGPAEGLAGPAASAPPLTRTAALVVFVVSWVALGLSVWSGLAWQSYARCQAGVNEQQALSQRGRIEAADRDRAADLQEAAADRAELAATKTLIIGVFNARGSEAVRQVYATYETALAEATVQRQQAARLRDEAERRRRENPPPPLPSETCG